MKIESKQGVPAVTVADDSIPVDPATGWVATTERDKQGVGLYVGTGGNIKMRMVGTPDTDPQTYRTWKNIPDGGYVIANVIEVHPDSTALDIQLLY